MAHSAWCARGTGTAETDFAPQLRGLSDTMQVVSFDPRGYGQSRPPRRDFPVDFYQQDADDAAALMAALGHTEYNVVGWSDGSIAAVLLAAKQKAAVGKLVIFGGNAYFTKEGAAIAASRCILLHLACIHYASGCIWMHPPASTCSQLHLAMTCLHPNPDSEAQPQKRVKPQPQPQRGGTTARQTTHASSGCDTAYTCAHLAHISQTSKPTRRRETSKGAGQSG